ncbi:hypothetical protein A0H81_10182 [Grifola frondosa]|uniref:Uncharacterized protein n=1 Tax=Grifola frondosa TaxID=5627 RepID=A0A1C7LZ34_GRIFR|nr:hypothetical protein A0H81_10182 [Grifola frondosa]
MFYNLITLFLPILALGKAVIANPLHARSVELAEVSSAPSQVANATILDTSVSAISGSGSVTAALAGLHTDAAQQEFPAYLYVCSGLNCGTSCFAYDLSDLYTVTCYATAILYLSVEVVQPSNDGLPFGVYVGTNCYGVLIPYVNTCYNINPAGNTFFVEFP